MKKLALLFLVVTGFLLAGAAQAADLTGHWHGKYEWVRPDGEEMDTPLYMILKQDGDKLTGTIGENVDERPNAVNGTLQGNKIDLEVKGFNRSSRITGTLDGDVINGNSAIIARDGSELKVKVVIKRVK